MIIEFIIVNLPLKVVAIKKDVQKQPYLIICMDFEGHKIRAGFIDYLPLFKAPSSKTNTQRR